MRLFVIGIGVVLVAGLFVFSYRYTKNSNSMIGTWRMVSGVYYESGNDSGILTKNTREMKIINESHFTTLWQDTVNTGNSGFNGGTYTYEGGIYTEYLEYYTFADRVGDVAHFKVDFNGDLLSISACDSKGNVSQTGYFQVWERVN